MWQGVGGGGTLSLLAKDSCVQNRFTLISIFAFKIIFIFNFVIKLAETKESSDEPGKLALLEWYG